MQGIERFLAKNKGKQTVRVPPPKTVEVRGDDGQVRQVPLDKIVPPQGGSGTAPVAPKPPQQPKKPKPKKLKQHPSDKGRLPDGAQFVTVYDASAVCWAGSLTVSGLMFQSQQSGLFRLLTILDGMYRAWAAKGGGA